MTKALKILSFVLNKRLARGLGAHGVMQLVQLFIRVAEIPLFLALWGAVGYGEWLMVASLPSALALSDGGFTKAASREMAMRASRGDEAGALQSFQSGWLLLVILSVVVMAMLAVILPFIPLDNWLKLSTVDSNELVSTLLLLAAQVFVSFQCGLLYGAFASQGSYATGTLYLALAYALGFIGLALGMAISEGMLSAASGAILGWLLGYLILWLAVRRTYPLLAYGLHHVSRIEMKRLFAPSFANLAFPIGDALNVQGIRILVGVMLGPGMLAVFSSIRTLCRVALQPVTSIARTIEPEISLAYGAGDSTRVRKLLLGGSRSAFWLSICLCVLLMLFGPLIFGVWTDYRLKFDWTTFSILLGASLIGSLWCVALTVPVATNRHMRVSIWFLVVYGVGSVALTWALTTMITINGAALAILIVEIAMAIIVVSASAKMVAHPLTEWPWAIVRMPFFGTRNGAERE